MAPGFQQRDWRRKPKVLVRSEISECLFCGYLLTGLSVTCVCPECGSEYYGSTTAWFGRRSVVSQGAITPGSMGILGTLVLVSIPLSGGSRFWVAGALLLMFGSLFVGIARWFFVSRFGTGVFVVADQHGLTFCFGSRGGVVRRSWVELREDYAERRGYWSDVRLMLKEYGIILPEAQIAGFRNELMRGLQSNGL